MINYFQAIQTAFNEKNAYQMFRRSLIAFFISPRVMWPKFMKAKLSLQLKCGLRFFPYGLGMEF